MKNEKLIYEEETFKIIGACMAVHNEMGCGFLESAYQEALEIELTTLQIPFESQMNIPVFFKGNKLKKYYKADFVCYENIIVELKSALFIHQMGKAQVINYLKATKYPVGLLINFGENSLQWKRFINTKQ